MRGFQLTIYHLTSMLLQITSQEDKGYLRARRNPGEHALANEDLTDGDTIKSTYQFTGLIIPYLHACRKALLMKGGECLDDVFAQPGTLFLIAAIGLAAGTNHSIEIFVDSHAVSVLPQQGAHGMTDVDFVREDDEALHRTEPENLRLVAKAIPGKDAVAVSQQQAVDAQVATYRKTSVVIAVMRIGKINLFRIFIYL